MVGVVKNQIVLLPFSQMIDVEDAVTVNVMPVLVRPDRVPTTAAELAAYDVVGRSSKPMRGVPWSEKKLRESLIAHEAQVRSNAKATPLVRDVPIDCDIDDLKMEQFTMSINRDLHCWQLSVNVTPISQTRSFNISISPKSSVLQDLRVNRTRYFTNY